MLVRTGCEHKCERAAGCFRIRLSWLPRLYRKNQVALKAPSGSRSNGQCTGLIAMQKHMQLVCDGTSHSANMLENSSPKDQRHDALASSVQTQMGIIVTMLPRSIMSPLSAAWRGNCPNLHRPRAQERYRGPAKDAGLLNIHRVLDCGDISIIVVQCVGY